MMDQLNRTYSSAGNQVLIKDEFNDLKLVDQYIPLEDVYVENLYPFDNNNQHQNGSSGAGNVHNYAQYHHHHPQYIQHNQSHDTDTGHIYEHGGMNKPVYEDFKENNSTPSLTMDSSTYMTSYYNNYNSHHQHNQSYPTPDQAQSVYNNYFNSYSREHGYPSAYTSHQSYYNLNSAAVATHKQPTVTSADSPVQSTSGYVTSTASSNDTSTSSNTDSHVKFLEARGLDVGNANGQINGEKPPEPYANIIVKAILSTNNNVMQLKDIYSYMIENYEYFSSQKQSTKWKNSVRHNLSRHKYFVKTCEKNAQGHYWSIDPAYLAIFKNGNFDEKSIKKAKLSSKLKNKAAKLIKKSRKNNQDKAKQIVSSHNNSSCFDMSSSYVANSSEMSSPTLSCKSFNSSTLNNDSAYMSGTEYANTSIQNFHSHGIGNGARAAEVMVGLNLRPNLNLHDALSEIYMDSGSLIHEQKQSLSKKIKKEPLLNY